MDRMPTRSPYVLIANLLVAGVVGYWMLSFGSAALMVIGTLLAYSAGWTWPGLLHFAVVRDNRLAAASPGGTMATRRRGRAPPDRPAPAAPTGGSPFTRSGQGSVHRCEG